MISKSKNPAVIFDLYNTLVDIEIDEDSPEFWKVIEDHLARYGSNLKGEDLKSLYQELCRQIKGNVLKGQSVLEILFPRYFHIATGHQADFGKLFHLVSVFRRASRKKIVIRDYALPLLRRLKSKGYQLAIISNTEAMFTKVDLEDIGIANKFDAIVLSSDVGAEKPDPKPFLNCLASLDLPPGQAVYVGDDFSADIIGANEVGIRSILMQDDKQGFENMLPESCLGIVSSSGKGIYKIIHKNLTY